MKNTLNPQENESNENKIEIIKYDFPKNTSYEKELMTNFKYFNIFWYDPDKTNDFDFFKNCFINIRLVKGINLESALNFFKSKLFSDEWIVITPGEKGKELIKNLEQNQFIYAFLIYCKNIEYHEKWAKNIQKVKCATSNPEILCKKLIELNQDYLFPNFNYGENITKRKNNEDYIFFWNLKKLTSENKFALNSVIREIKNAANNINKSENIFSKFCIKSLNYLNCENCIKDFKEPIPNETPIFNQYAHSFRKKKNEEIEIIINEFKYFFLLPLYFSEYEYLMNLISYEEIKELFNDVHSEHHSKNIIKIPPFLKQLIEKILNNENILELEDELKEIQKALILNILLNCLNFYGAQKEFIDNYHIVNNLRDFGFCSKIFVYFFAIRLDNKFHNFSIDLVACTFQDQRCYDFFNNLFNNNNDTNKNEYLPDDLKIKIKEKALDELTEEKIIKINNLLSQKNFLIIGEKEFKEEIKTIEKDLKIETIKYLKINEITNYINEKNKNDHKKNKVRIFFYYVIIQYEEFKEYFEKMILLSAELGISFLIILYIEKNNILFPKSYIRDNNLISIINVYSTKDILRYFSNTNNLKFSKNPIDIFKAFDMIKSEEKEEISDLDNQDDYQDGCFELSETFNYKIVQNKIILNTDGDIDYYSSISEDIYNIYKEHNALDLFFNQNIKYFRFCLKIEMTCLDISFIKMILYLYCREEKEHEKSFYRMINDDLRSKSSSKIDRLIVLLSLINKLIENKEIASFKGKVYRATKLDENLILKLKANTIMINTTFWSTSKNFKVAENFMKKNSWRNTFIICDTLKTNIDIDYEKLNPYNEYEVLIPPFNEFKVKKIYSENKYGINIYIIELVELGNKNLVKFENMNNENINFLNFLKKLKNYVEEFVHKNFELVG